MADAAVPPAPIQMPPVPDRSTKTVLVIETINGVEIDRYTITGKRGR